MTVKSFYLTNLVYVDKYCLKFSNVVKQSNKIIGSIFIIFLKVANEAMKELNNKKPVVFCNIHLKCVDIAFWVNNEFSSGQ